MSASRHLSVRLVTNIKNTGSGMKTIRHNSTRVALGRLGGSGVVEANYTGPMTDGAFSALRNDVLGTTSSAFGLVLRLDRMLDLTAALEAPHAGSYVVGMPPGAVIVRADQYDKFVNYNRKVAALGVMRSVWLEEHAHLAYQWVMRQSVARLQEVQP